MEVEKGRHNTGGGIKGLEKELKAAHQASLRALEAHAGSASLTLTLILTLTLLGGQGGE